MWGVVLIIRDGDKVTSSFEIKEGAGKLIQFKANIGGNKMQSSLLMKK